MKKKQFDAIIKQNLSTIYGEACFGYVLAKVYDAYYSREAFGAFLSEMQSEKYAPYYQAYAKGKGSELKEQPGKYGVTPPKMASVASSSRFCYLALRDGASGLGGGSRVQFEHACRIQGIFGTAPQLDAYIPDKNIYVEAKCHEIFDLHTIKMATKYWDYLYGRGNDFGLPVLERPDTDTFVIPAAVFGIDKSHTLFDIKQFLCHLLGIASQKHRAEEASLVYLFFKPKTQTEDSRKEIDEVFLRLQQEITALFRSAHITAFTAKHNIALSAIAEYAEVMEPLTTQNTISLVSV
ncbi:MAG: hypothetical protein IJ518_00715 [Clostridia bacterium]|nr:hypothetical protein [Clostridia bacterium]